MNWKKGMMIMGCLAVSLLIVGGVQTAEAKKDKPAAVFGGSFKISNFSRSEFVEKYKVPLGERMLRQSFTSWGQSRFISSTSLVALLLLKVVLMSPTSN